MLTTICVVLAVGMVVYSLLSLLAFWAFGDDAADHVERDSRSWL